MRFPKLTLFVLLVVAVALAATYVACHAQEPVQVPKLSMQRVSASFGADVEWIPAKLAPLKDKQFVPVLATAYKLGNNLAAVASVRCGFSDRQFRYNAGLRYTFFRDGKWVNP